MHGEGIGSRRVTLDRRFLALVALSVVAGGCARAGGEAFQPTHSAPVRLPDRGTVGQSFASATGEVAGVDLVTATYGAPADPDGRLRVRLLAEPAGEPLGEGVVAGDRLGDSAWVGVTFQEPVAVPARAAFSVSWTGDTPVALFANTPRDGQVPQIANDPYRGGELLLDGQPAVGDLAFRIRGTGGAAAALDQAVEVAASAGGRLPEQPLFAVGWLVAVAGAGALAVAGFRGAGRRQRRRA